MIGDIMYIIVECLKVTGVFETQNGVIREKVAEFPIGLSCQNSVCRSPRRLTLLTCFS